MEFKFLKNQKASNDDSKEYETDSSDIDLNIDIEKHFPNLAKEVIRKSSKELSIKSIRFHDNEIGNANETELKNPDVISFLRRCDTDEQGIEIIDFMMKRNEITKDLAESLKIQLKTKGIRSFGSKKEAGYYDNTY
ncbi:MAG: DUF2095 domain-containing protein [Candidatus Lokiarchaeota archaeon]|nr:DUF2095 domain-containing protein [Candidatus Lokiarchaeota archaeon]